MTDLIKYAFDLFLHLDKHLNEIISQYGAFTHVILFVIIFCETGLVVTPFLPGDSLLFAAGVFAASGSLNIWVLLVSLSVAAILGDSVNYKLGQIFGENARFINPKHIQRTHEFYERYGPSTIIIARFVPIVRTFAPFVAGVGSMSYAKFLTYNVFGGLLWVFLLTLGGYFFANVPVVKENFSFVVVAIIVISVMPAVVEFARAWLGRRAAPQGEGPGNRQA
ncbi:MAG: DedA family protein [Candidatus Hydrogenedentes bacterium]|nr:DedA family protein [Candidatus Hydrogenedentota bacterium]